jgi:hypothetical protein
LRISLQASLQTVTASQLRAQRRRQTIGRPHTAQGLDGTAALLPLNPFVRAPMREPGIRGRGGLPIRPS